MDYQANILIVDDLPENLLALEVTLEGLGQNIVKATSGEEALRQLLKHEFAVILLDVTMPIMDGFELAHLIRQRERTKHTPIIFLTAYAQEDQFLKRGYELGALDYLFKPFAPEILRWKVSVLVDLYLKTLESAHYAEIQRLNTELEQSNWALNHAVLRTNELYDLSRAIGQSREAAEVLSLLASSSYLRDALMLNAFVLDPKAKASTAQLEASFSRAEPPIDPVPVYLSPDQTIVVRMAGDDPRLDEAQKSQLEAAGVQSLVQFPLYANGERFGVLAICWECPLPLGAEDLRHVEGLVDQVAAALYSFRMFDAETLARKRAEHADQLKTRFLELVSHELRTPLTSIKGFTTTMLEPGPSWDDASQQQFLQIIDEETDNLTDLVDHLLTMTHIEANTLQVLRQSQRLQDLIADALPRLTLLCGGRQLLLDVPADLPPVQADAWRITQVIAHLVANASKYSPPNASVMIVARETNDMVQVDVIDQGMGIPTEEQERIFQPFYQAENRPVNLRGAGLGLPIAKAVIEYHQGRI